MKCCQYEIVNYCDCSYGQVLTIDNINNLNVNNLSAEIYLLIIYIFLRSNVCYIVCVPDSLLGHVCMYLWLVVSDKTRLNVTRRDIKSTRSVNGPIRLL